MKRPGVFRAVALTCVVAASAISSGCAQIEAGATNLAINLIERRVIPPQLEIKDVDMACRFAASNFPLLSAGTRAFNGDPSLIETLLYTSAGVCSEARAVEAELRYLRASRQNNIEEAQDARIQQKRLLELTARRQLAGFQAMRNKLELHRRRPEAGGRLEEVDELIGRAAALARNLLFAARPEGVDRRPVELVGMLQEARSLVESTVASRCRPPSRDRCRPPSPDRDPGPRTGCPRTR